jgi:hypothetical protein
MNERLPSQTSSVRKGDVGIGAEGEISRNSIGGCGWCGIVAVAVFLMLDDLRTSDEHNYNEKHPGQESLRHKSRFKRPRPERACDTRFTGGQKAQAAGWETSL